MKFRVLSIIAIASLALFACNGGSKSGEAAPQPAPEVKTEPALAFCPDSLGEEPVFDIVTT